MLCVFTIGVFRLQNIFDEKSILIRRVLNVHATAKLPPIFFSDRGKPVEKNRRFFSICKKKKKAEIT